MPRRSDMQDEAIEWDVNDKSGRSKRRRKTTNHFEFDSIQNEEQKLYQQALKNSTIDHFNVYSVEPLSKLK